MIQTQENIKYTAPKQGGQHQQNTELQNRKCNIKQCSLCTLNPKPVEKQKRKKKEKRKHLCTVLFVLE